MNGQYSRLGLLLMLVAVAARAEVPELTAAVRPLLESTLREQAGIGFDEFSCAAELPLTAGERFTCTAVDEDGDRLRYVLTVDDEGIATVVRASQPAASLPAELLEELSEPCRSFLAYFDFRRWDTLVSGLHPALQAELDWERVRGRLESVRDLLGEMQPVTASWYTATASGRHQLDYRLVAGVDGGVARFELERDDNGAWRVISFIVTAEAGSDANVALATEQGREVLGGLLGAPVDRLEAPIQALSAPGDMVEGTAVLEDGRTLPIAVQQTGHLDDFDPSDYFYSVLDTETVVATGLGERVDDVDRVECDAPVVPDGGEVPCVVRRANGTELEVIVMRRGAEHRLRSP